jgi:hypothetical protein
MKAKEVSHRNKANLLRIEKVPFCSSGVWRPQSIESGVGLPFGFLVTGQARGTERSPRSVGIWKYHLHPIWVLAPKLWPAKCTGWARSFNLGFCRGAVVVNVGCVEEGESLGFYKTWEWLRKDRVSWISEYTRTQQFVEVSHSWDTKGISYLLFS